MVCVCVWVDVVTFNDAVVLLSVSHFNKTSDNQKCTFEMEMHLKSESEGAKDREIESEREFPFPNAFSATTFGFRRFSLQFSIHLCMNGQGVGL